MKQEFMKQIDAFVAENKDAILRDIARLVAINSVESEAVENGPFGIGPKEALKLALEIATELGLQAVNCEDYMGYASIGNSEKYLATITHLDIVPVGEGWSQDPFTMREKDGYILGRGVMDDKGPSVLCLYALKFLKDHNIPLRYEIRALLGLNEETGMGDVKYYLANYPAPAFCFSPDANFPLCNGEKGIFHGNIISACVNSEIEEIHGGFAPNAIPDKAHAVVKKLGLPSADGISVQEKGGKSHITAVGIGGHASLPEGTVNAIGVLVSYLLDNKLCSEAEERFFKKLMLLHSAWDGSALGVAADDGLFDPLTIVGGMIGLKDGHFVQTLDSRYPTNTNGKKIAAQIAAVFAEDGTVELSGDKEPFYMALDNPAVQVCINAYNDITREGAKPYTIGGGTYARCFPNAVSFGPEHPERPQPAFVGPIHGVDEGASIADFMEALKVYILAFVELQELDF